MGGLTHDALHCRTRAIWDPEMLFMSMKRIDSGYPAEKNRIYATLIDYSKKGLQKEKSELLWRLVGKVKWNTLPLTQIENTIHYYADIPERKIGDSVEY